MEFSRQEYWRGLPFPSPGDLPNPGVWKPQVFPEDARAQCRPRGFRKLPSCCTILIALTTGVLSACLSLHFAMHTPMPGAASPSALPTTPGRHPVYSSGQKRVGRGFRVSVDLAPRNCSFKVQVLYESQHTRPPGPSPTPRVHSDSHPSSQ